MPRSCTLAAPSATGLIARLGRAIRLRPGLGRPPAHGPGLRDRAARPLSWLLLLLTLLGPTVASASKPRCRLEQVDLTAFEKHSQIKVVGGRVELEGTLSPDQPPPVHRLLVAGKPVAKAEKIEPFERSGRDMYIALLIENSALYAPSIEKIKEAVKEFLESMPPRVKVRLFLYGYEIEQQPNFMPAPAVTALLDDINPDDQGDVQLLRAISAGLLALNKVQPGHDKDGKPQPAPRKLMVVLSDGLNELMDRKSFRRTGDLLRQSNVSLFPIAFSPRDDRGPLLNLGELAKRSAGTFRWAQKDENLKEQFQSLSEELRQTPVFTFTNKKLDLDDLRAATFGLQCAELKSQPFSFSGVPPKKPSRWWLWLIGIPLGLVGLWGLAMLAAFLLKRRAAKLGIVVPPSGAPTKPGQTLAVPSGQPAVAAVYQPVPMQPGGRLFTATLIGIGAGPLGGRRIKVEAGLLIGKGQYPTAPAGVLFVPDDSSLGERHCELRRDGAGFALFDSGVPSGTFINDRRVTAATRLADGDIIRLGEATQFRFRLDD